ncbi:MAG: hypothetical protein GY796_11500 [Chloroflexi bacterium]|nr:hypothetical protein [Chloroflexota bacterium]
MSTIAASTSLAAIKVTPAEGLNSKLAFRVRPASSNKDYAAAVGLDIEGLA